MHRIYCQMSASISEVKKDPLGVLAAGEGDAVLVFAKDEPAFYCVPPELFALLHHACSAQGVEASQGAVGEPVGTD